MITVQYRLRSLVALLVIFVLSIPMHPALAATRNIVPIVVYHHIGIGENKWYFGTRNFEAQLAYLVENGYRTVTMQTYLDAEQKGILLPGKPVVLTFDDGYRDAYDNAFPLLKKYGMTGTFFVITGMVGAPDYLTWNQIEEMHRAGMEFGAHTVHHVFLTRLSPLRAFWEIWKSRFDLEWHLNTPIEVFAYPYNDHNQAVVSLVRLAGFRGACIVSAHNGDVPGNSYEVTRITVLPAERLKIFAMMITGKGPSLNPLRSLPGNMR